MSWPSAIMYAVVAFVGFPAAFRFWGIRNPTAAVLTMSWMAAEIAYIETGDSFPLRVYFMADVAVISVILAKSVIRCGSKTFSSFREQIRCLVDEITTCDKWVAALFLLGAWPLYILNIHPYYKWWLLWAIVIIQFLLAGAEAALSFRHAVKKRAPPDPPVNGLALAGVHRWLTHSR